MSVIARPRLWLPPLWKSPIIFAAKHWRNSSGEHIRNPDGTHMNCEDCECATSCVECTVCPSGEIDDELSVTLTQANRECPPPAGFAYYDVASLSGEYIMTFDGEAGGCCNFRIDFDPPIEIDQLCDNGSGQPDPMEIDFAVATLCANGTFARGALWSSGTYGIMAGVITIGGAEVEDGWDGDCANIPDAVLVEGVDEVSRVAIAPSGDC